MKTENPVPITTQKIIDRYNMKESTANIKQIRLMFPYEIAALSGRIPRDLDYYPLVTILFKFPCRWTTLTVNEFFKILRGWLEAEKIRCKDKPNFLIDEIRSVLKEYD